MLKNLAIDPDAGDMRETLQEVVPAGTVALEINECGKYEAVQQVDDLWAIRTTVHAAGLAGQASNGVARRTYRYRDNYSWPRILNYIDIQPILADPGDAYSNVVQYAWRPVWLTEGYDGPCEYEIVERWTLKQPQPGGKSSWNTLSPANESPDLPWETPMILREITFQGADLNLQIPPCLHSGQWIRDSQFYQAYPPSIPMRWPATILSRVTLTPDSGGWLTRQYLVHAPQVEGASPLVNLRQQAEPDPVEEDEEPGEGESEETPEVAGKTITLVWNAGPGDAELDVCTSPTFAGGFLPDYYKKPLQNKVKEVVTGATKGIIYYARITRGGEVSNTCICATKPVPELGVHDAGQPVLSGEEVSIGQVTVGESGSYVLTLRNAGLKLLSDIHLVIEGTDGAMMTAGAVPTYLLPNSGADVVIEFTPTSAGEKTAVLTVSSNESADPFKLTLKGMGAAGEIQVEQPEGSVLEVDDGVDFGTVTGGSTSRVFKVVNVGNSPLRNVTVALSGDHAGDFNVAADVGTDTLGPGGFTNFTLTFEPQGGQAAGEERSAVLTITSDDSDENPFTLGLSGVFQDPLAAGAPDLAYEAEANGEVLCVAMQSDGRMIIGGSFTEVNGVARGRIARLNTDGTLDGFNPGADGAVRAVAVQADGAVVYGGAFTTAAGNAHPWLVRVSSAGTYDGSFLPVLNDEVRTLAVQTDGDILLGGDFTLVNGVSRPWLARLNGNGTLDSGFATEVNGPVNGLALMRDGRMMVVGEWAAVVDSSEPPPSSPPVTYVPSSEPPPPSSSSESESESESESQSESSEDPSSYPPLTSYPPPSSYPPYSSVAP